LLNTWLLETQLVPAAAPPELPGALCGGGAAWWPSGAPPPQAPRTSADEAAIVAIPIRVAARLLWFISSSLIVRIDAGDSQRRL